MPEASITGSPFDAGAAVPHPLRADGDPDRIARATTDEESRMHDESQGNVLLQTAPGASRAERMTRGAGSARQADSRTTHRTVTAATRPDPQAGALEYDSWLPSPGEIEYRSWLQHI